MSIMTARKKALSLISDPRSAQLGRDSARTLAVSTALAPRPTTSPRVLEDEIVAGAIAPGTVLRQEQLSERFDVSRTPVREALRRLAALGLVSFEPNRGVRVRSISRPSSARRSSSAPSSRRSRPRSRRPKMTPDDLAALDAAERRFSRADARAARAGAERATARDSTLFVEWMQANYAFHDVIYRAAEHAARRAPREGRAPDVHRRPVWSAAPSSTSSTRRTTCSTARSARRSRPAAPGGAACSRASTCSRRARLIESSSRRSGIGGASRRGLGHRA